MFKSACDAMKKSIMLSAVLVVTGVILEIIAQFLTLESMIPAVFTYGGFIVMSLGLFLMLGTLLVTLLPFINRRLNGCQH